MNTKEIDRPALQDAAQMSRTCLEHLGREEAMLDATLGVLRQVRTALLGGDQSALTEARQRQEEMVQAREELRQSREQLRHEAAAGLGIPAESVTLQTLAGRLPADVGQRLARGRENLCRKAMEVDQINQSNAALIFYYLDFLNRFFAEITGSEPSTGRYGPAGTPQETVGGSIIEARG